MHCATPAATRVVVLAVANVTATSTPIATPTVTSKQNHVNNTITEKAKHIMSKKTHKITINFKYHKQLFKPVQSAMSSAD